MKGADVVMQNHVNYNDWLEEEVHTVILIDEPIILLEIFCKDITCCVQSIWPVFLSAKERACFGCFRLF